MIRNQKGFALVMTLALLPVLIAGMLLAWAAVGFFQQDLALKHACRKQGLEGQRKVAPLLKKLLQLNPEARTLKERRDELRLKIAAATASGQVHMVELWKIELDIVEFRRLQLSLRQKNIITESNRLLQAAHNIGRRKIEDHAKETSNLFINLRLTQLNGHAPRLAVRPDYPDIAPTFSTVLDFSNQQALAHEWHYSATVGAPFSHFLPGKFEFHKACAVSLRKDLNAWSPQITKARYSWKSVW